MFTRRALIFGAGVALFTSGASLAGGVGASSLLARAGDVPAPLPAVENPPSRTSDAFAPDVRPRFFGPSYPPPAPSSPHGRVASLGYGAWIFATPRRSTLPIGAPRDGGELAIVDAAAVPADGACGSYVRVAGGYLCSARRTTTAPEHAFVEAMRWATPAPGAWPYEYAVSYGAPLLSRLPRDGERLPDVGDRTRRLTGWHDVHDDLAEPSPIEPNGDVPEPLRDGRALPTPWGKPLGLVVKTLPRGSTVAYTRAFRFRGEVWVLTSDLRVVPARGLSRFGRSSFRGLELGARRLPIAWTRLAPVPLFAQHAGRFVPSGEVVPARTPLDVSSDVARSAGRRFRKLRHRELWLPLDAIGLAEAPSRVPHEVAPGGKWIHVQRRQGTLTLFEGEHAVFTTLASMGVDGATPTGRHFVESKHHVTTMSGESGEPRRFWMSEVPWAIYYDRPFALHAAYWHDGFGEPRSGGCPNLSPLDAERVFRWVDPELPAGWNMAQSRWKDPARTFILIKD